MPSITQLTYLLAVARHRHFGRAALECRVSQPTLSAQVRKLEEELDVVVFDRNTKPILCTDQGKRVLELAQDVVSGHRRLLEHCQTLGREPSGPFTLALIPTVATYVLPLFIDSFASRYPRVQLTVREMETAALVTALLDDRIDAGIAATPIDEKRLRARTLFYEPFQVYLSRQHMLLRRKQLREHMLDSGELWLLENGHCLRDQVARVCSVGKGASAYGNVHFAAGSLETLRQVVRDGKGYTLVPELFVQQLPAYERKRHVRPIVGPVPTREVSMLFRRDQLKSVIRKQLADTIRSGLPAGVSTSRRAAMRVIEATPL